MTNSPFPPGALVASYLRDSGGQFQELSLPRQESEFRRWCEQNGLIPGRVFKDEARPGSNVVGRVSFQEMMAYFRSGRAQEAGLVIWNYQRFARDIDDSQFFRADLRRRGYIIHSLNDEIPEGSMGRLFEAILDWKNEQFLTDLSIDIKSGMRHLVETYRAVPGIPPRGFKRDPVQIASHRNDQPRIVHRWIPDPDQIPHVRQAFQMLLSGASLAEIKKATRLYTSLNSYKTFFSNPIYKGVLEYGDLVIQDYCEPVITPDVWDQAQTIIAKRARRQHLKGDNPNHPRRTGQTYVLSGLVYCARCGSILFGHSTKQPNGSYHQEYACTRRYRNRDCDARPIPRIFLEDMIMKAFQKQLLTPENLAAMRTVIEEKRNHVDEELEQRRNELQSRLNSVRRRLTNITETLAEQGGTSRALLSKLGDLEGEESEVLSEFALINEQPQQVDISYSDEELRDLIGQFNAISKTVNPVILNRILRSMIHKINLERTDDSVLAQILYYFPPSIPSQGAYDASLVGGALGVPPHTHTFTFSLTAPFTRKRKNELSEIVLTQVDDDLFSRVCAQTIDEEISL